MLKLLFQLLKTLPAFQKLLSEHFDAERAELQAAADDWKANYNKARMDCAYVGNQRDIAHAEAERYKQRTVELLDRAISYEKEIADLKNATTQKLKAVDAMPTDAVWDASIPVRGPKPAPRS